MHSDDIIKKCSLLGCLLVWDLEKKCFSSHSEVSDVCPYMQISD